MNDTSSSDTPNDTLSPEPENQRGNSMPEKAFKKGIHFVEFVGLVIIAIATVIAGGIAVDDMIQLGTVTLGDLLLLFLYLEVLAMVAIYLDSGKLPVRLPLYIAIVALARYLILDMKDLSEWQMIAIAVTITLITLSTLILRYGHITFPYKQNRTNKNSN